VVAKAQKINLKDIKQWSGQEGQIGKYDFFIRRIKG
jgi:hypothetical protein